MEKYMTDERTGLKYELVGDYYLIAGDDKPDEEQKPIGIWGQRHLHYLKNHRKVLYANLLTSGKLNTYPFVSRATMCYFPKCDRTQGVDYTNTELNLHFGRIDDKGKIKEMNEDIQNCDEVDTTNAYHILEGEARAKFRKWDNVKYITEIPKSRSRTKKSYSNKNWGMEIKTNNRLDPKDGEGIRFGVVVTLKEINGINRIDEFIKNCTLNGWLVNKVDIKTRIDIHEKVNEEIEFQ